MPTSLLENIPAELLARVCEYIGLSHRPSLRSFALASKRCHAVAKRLFFHTIEFSSNSPRQLELDVGECISILERNASFSSVRILLITGRQDEDSDDGALSSPAYGGTRSWSFGLPLSLSEIVDGDKDRLQSPVPRSTLIPTPVHELNPDIANRTDARGQPLARLVQMLPRLDDVLYSGIPQLPPYLLRALLQYQPRCRLHVFTFGPRSLHLTKTDPDELALVTVPCLYSIWMWYYNESLDYGAPDYHADAMYNIVRGLAPNLKEVHLFQDRSYSYGNDGNFQPPPLWNGFTYVGQDLPCAPAQLESLELGVNMGRSLDEEAVDGWRASTNLSFLRALRINRVVSSGALRCLIGAGSFPCLTTLLFICAKREEDAYYDDIKEFIRCLPQLTSLKIIAWPPNISLAVALPSGLRELWLRTQDVLGQSLDEAAILELAARCPRVETLALKIRRSRGDAAEVALYKAVGRFTGLRRLVLTLDASPAPWFPVASPDRCSNRATAADLSSDERYLQYLDETTYDTAIDPSFDEFDSQYLPGKLHPYRNGHIRDAFINTAVDETLARAIFRTVCAAKARAYGDGAALALERVMIRPEGGNAFPRRSIMMPPVWNLRPYVVALGRCWLLERDVRDDARQTIHAREIDNEGRFGSVVPDWFAKAAEREYSREFMPIFRRIWPERPGLSSKWYEDWHSWPLAETT
ncbi:hypothetical protein VTI74DRAFT_9939 [Chaetomium olivicolor]